MIQKVLLVIPTYLPIVGGAELAVHNIARALNKNNISADILTFNIKEKRWSTHFRTKIEYVDGIKVFYLGAINICFFLNNKYKSILLRIIGIQLLPSFKLFSIVKEYDLIHFNDEVNLSIPFFLLLSQKKKIFHLRTLVQLYSSFQKYPFPKWILKHSANNFIIESKRYIALLKELGIKETNFIHWAKGVNTGTFKKIDQRPTNKIFTLLSIGRISDKNKGFHIVLDAFEKIKESLKLIIITPLYEENIYSQKLLEQIENISRQTNKFIDLIVDKTQSELVEYYNIADLFVFTPLEESMPNVLLEAGSCELPIISTKVGGIPEIIIDGKTGVLIEPNDSESLVNTIIQLKNNSAFRNLLGIGAKEYIQENFSYDNSIKNLITIYNNL